MDRVTITIDVPGVGAKQANVRHSLRVADLITEVRDRFEFGGTSYTLRLKGAREALDPTRTLEQHGVPEGAQLVFAQAAAQDTGVWDLIDTGQRRPITRDNQVYLEERRQNLVYEIEWQPALIGRADQRNPSRNRLLAVDLSGLRGAEYASRQHACITEENDQYFIQPLNPRNPTYVNNTPLDPDARVVLQPGDRIRVGKISLVFNQRG
jgi:hypothetical protein